MEHPSTGAVLPRRSRVRDAGARPSRNQCAIELDTHLLPEHLARARNAVNLGPTLQTVAATGRKGRSSKFPEEIYSRH